jgi:putative ABC transport system permease protein
MYLTTGSTIATGDRAMRLTGLRMSADMFGMLGTSPFLGRTFEAREAAAGSDGVVIFSYAVWQQLFAGEPDIIGRTVMLDARAYEVLGVMPPDFRFPDPYIQYWVPYVFPAGRGALLQRTSPIARLRRGVAPETAAAEVASILRRRRQDAGLQASAAPQVQVIRIHEQLVAPVKPALLVLAGAVGCVLIIACVNVANLLLARTVARRREIAVRRALGASNGRLARQALTESVLLALIGGVAAVALAAAAVGSLRAIGLGLQRRDLGVGVGIPRLDEVGLDIPVLLFTLAASVLTGLLFGVAPAFRHSRGTPLHALRGVAASTVSGFDLLRRQPGQGLLVVVEIAMAVILLVGGGLLLRSFAKLSNVDLGYEPSNILTFRVSVPGGRAAAARSAALAEDLVERLVSVPGVRGAAYAEHLPLVQTRSGVPLRRTPDFPTGPPPPPGAANAPQFADVHVVSRDFLGVLGMRLAAGRGFRAGDGAGQPPVMLVNETLARSGWFAGNPIGQRIYAIGRTPWEIVGIVEDVRQYGLDQQPAPQVFVDLRQLPGPAGATGAVEYFAIRLVGERTDMVPTLRELVRQLDDVATVESVATMEQLVSNAVARPRLYTVLLGLFAAIAAALAVIGVSGVMAYAVAQRTREVGIRLALGAQRAAVLRLILGQSLLLTALGIVVGLAGAAGLSRYLERFLFGIAPLDVVTFAAVALTFTLAAALAAVVPARRAMRVDPAVALRSE